MDPVSLFLLGAGALALLPKRSASTPAASDGRAGAPPVPTPGAAAAAARARLPRSTYGDPLIVSGAPRGRVRSSASRPAGVDSSAIAIGKVGAQEVVRDVPGLGLATRIIGAPGQLAGLLSGTDVPDPVTGATIAVVGGVTGLATGVADVFANGLGGPHLTPAQQAAYDAAVANPSDPSKLQAALKSGALGAGDGSKLVRVNGEDVRMGGTSGRGGRFNAGADAPDDAAELDTDDLEAVGRTTAPAPVASKPALIPNAPKPKATTPPIVPVSVPSSRLATVDPSIAPPSPPHPSELLAHPELAPVRAKLASPPIIARRFGRRATDDT